TGTAGLPVPQAGFPQGTVGHSQGTAGHSQGTAGHPQGVPPPTTGHERLVGAEFAPDVEETGVAIRAVVQPVLAVARGTLSATACVLVRSADFTLAANDAVLTIPITKTEDDTLTGAQAARLGYVTWAVPANDLRKEMERVLDML